MPALRPPRRSPTAPRRRWRTVRFTASYLRTRKLLSAPSDGGRIVDIAPGLTRLSFPNRTIYGPVEGRTCHMALKPGPRGIIVQTVTPGAIATDFSGGANRDGPEVDKAIRDRTALDRIGASDDVGSVIAVLLSNDLAS